MATGHIFNLAKKASVRILFNAETLSVQVSRDITAPTHKETGNGCWLVCVRSMVVLRIFCGRCRPQASSKLPILAWAVEKLWPRSHVFSFCNAHLSHPPLPPFPSNPPQPHVHSRPSAVATAECIEPAAICVTGVSPLNASTRASSQAGDVSSPAAGSSGRCCTGRPGSGWHGECLSRAALLKQTAF